MELKNLNTNKRKLQVLLNSFVWLTCIFYTSFAGCTPESTTMTVHPQQEHAAHSKELDVKQIKQPDTMLATPAEKKELMQLVTLPKPETAKNNSKMLEYKSKFAPTRKTIIPVAARGQVHSSRESLRTSKNTITTAEQPSSETAVNLPVLNKPGMADELICVNFDQVDIRIVL